MRASEDSTSESEGGTADGVGKGDGDALIDPNESPRATGRGTLFIVSTPIGNLGDMTFRAVETLSRVAVVLCEDTRYSRRLLDHFAIRTPAASYHEHNEARETPKVVDRLLGGDDVALISDAGTPLLSDPGARLVRAAVAAGLVVSPIPGASALLGGLVASGLGADTFTFFGFLPRRGGERAASLSLLSALTHTGVVYEAANRVADTLGDLVRSGCGERQVVVARELTKHHEEMRRGTVQELEEYYREKPPRGEIVMVLEGATAGADAADEVTLRESARTMRAEGATTREIVRSLVDRYGAARNLAYRLAQDVGRDASPHDGLDV